MASPRNARGLTPTPIGTRCVIPPVVRRPVVGAIVIRRGRIIVRRGVSRSRPAPVSPVPVRSWAVRVVRSSVIRASVIVRTSVIVGAIVAAPGGSSFRLVRRDRYRSQRGDHQRDGQKQRSHFIYLLLVSDPRSS